MDEYKEGKTIIKEVIISICSCCSEDDVTACFACGNKFENDERIFCKPINACNHKHICEECYEKAKRAK